mmetsp:Transcript_32734/g.97598  ORF Transcript_32734/g.97598 Transcript_32734/m.97598 type:complete len:361 (-) Transcript_32734:813-1895(-)
MWCQRPRNTLPSAPHPISSIMRSSSWRMRLWNPAADSSHSDTTRTASGDASAVSAPPPIDVLLSGSNGWIPLCAAWLARDVKWVVPEAGGAAVAWTAVPDLKPGKLSLTLEAERAGEVGAQPSPSFGVRACSACTEPMLPVSRLSHMLERGTRGKLSPCATAADFSTATSHALIPPALLPVTTLAPRASKAVRRLLCARIMCCGRVHVGSLPWPMRTMPMLALGSAHMASLPSSSPRIMQSSAWQTLMLTTGGPWGPTAHTADTRPLLRSHNRQSPPAWPVSRRQPRASGALDCGTSERQLTATITEHMPYLLKLMEPSWVASDARRRCSVHAAVAAVTVSCFARMAVTGVPGCGASLAP